MPSPKRRPKLHRPTMTAAPADRAYHERQRAITRRRAEVLGLTTLAAIAEAASLRAESVDLDAQACAAGMHRWHDPASCKPHRSSQTTGGTDG